MSMVNSIYFRLNIYSKNNVKLISYFNFVYTHFSNNSHQKNIEI